MSVAYPEQREELSRVWRVCDDRVNGAVEVFEYFTEVAGPEVNTIGQARLVLGVGFSFSGTAFRDLPDQCRCQRPMLLTSHDSLPARLRSHAVNASWSSGVPSLSM